MGVDLFLQGEDGIRDYKVTGVQTCALPIWLPGSVPRARRQEAGGEDDGDRMNRMARIGDGEGRACCAGNPLDQNLQNPKRSEERRVGKRSRAKKVTDNTKRTDTTNTMKLTS